MRIDVYLAIRCGFSLNHGNGQAVNQADRRLSLGSTELAGVSERRSDIGPIRHIGRSGHDGRPEPPDPLPSAFRLFAFGP
jgi:hypothetical protein